MRDLRNQVDYWDSAGTAKTFGHPIDVAWLDGLDRRARILDYGCGYGRVAGLLLARGFEAVEGVDVAERMIDRARMEHPTARFAVLSGPPRLPHEAGTVDAALLVTVLTCVPTDAGQQDLVAELRRVLRPGGLLYVSDLCLQDDARNAARYEQFADTYGIYGVFETDDGAVCRHHTMEWLRELFAEFDVSRTRDVAVATMNGHPARATQLLLAAR